MERRNTASKDAVLSVLKESKKAMSQDAIEKKVEVGVDRVTIYRILNRFCQDGVLHKIVADDGKQYFGVRRECNEKSVPNNHFHFRCTRCLTLECLPAQVNFNLPENYAVEALNCVLIGTCDDCNSLSKASQSH